MSRVEIPFQVLCSSCLIAIFLSTANGGGLCSRGAIAAILYLFGLIDSETANNFAMGTWLPWYE